MANGELRHPDDIAKSLYIHPSNRSTSSIIALADRLFVLEEYQKLYSILEEAQKTHQGLQPKDFASDAAAYFWQRLGETLNGQQKKP